MAWQWPAHDGLTMTAGEQLPDNNSWTTTAWTRLYWPDDDEDGLTTTAWRLWPEDYGRWVDNNGLKTKTARWQQPEDDSLMTARWWLPPNDSIILHFWVLLCVQTRPNDSKLKTPQASFWGRFACQSLTLLKLKNAFCLPNKGSKNEGWPHRSCFGKHDSFHFAISRPCVTIITAAATQFWLLLVLADHELLFLSSTRSLPQQFSWWALECKDA